MLSLTEDQKMIQDMVRDFCEKEIAPIAGKIDQEASFPHDTINKMGELGLLGIPIPEEYGGAGMDTLTYSIVIEELGKVCASHCITTAAHTSLCTMPIFIFGNDAQKNKYLPKLTSGETLGSFCLTEPETGSDARSMSSFAEKVDGGYQLNGNKAFITNAGVAGVYVCFAVSKKTDKGTEISAFILEKGMKGLNVAAKERKMGWCASDTRQINFDNVFIPDENLLGEEGKGFEICLETLRGGRISIAAMSLGIGEGAYEAALKYSKERHQFNKPISAFQSTQIKIADMGTKIIAGKLMIYHAARLKDSGKNFEKEAAMAKLFNSEAATWIAKEAIQIHGGFGYTKEYPVERFFRDAKACEIGEGTSEIQRILISKLLSK